MEPPEMGPDPVTSGIKRRVKDRKVSKTTLNVSLASKIKTKIINNSSIFKISLKHNNRALAQALSRERANSRRIATEKMLLQKEVEKLNFENTFLRLKLDNLNKKLIEIESLLSNNLVTAIEMSSLSEFHQSSFLPSTSKKKQSSRLCESMRLPFARVPLPSNDDDDEDKEKMQWDHGVTSRVPPDVPSSELLRQSAPIRRSLDTLFLKGNNQNMCGLDDSEHISSIAHVLPKERHSHLDRSSQPATASRTTSTACASLGRAEPSLSNVTARKKRGSARASHGPAADTSSGADSEQQQSLSPQFDWNVEVDDCTNEKNIAVLRNPQRLPGLESRPASARELDADHVGHMQNGGDPQGQTTVYGADMELTATDVSTIVTISRGSRRKSNKTVNDCERKTFRKVRDGGSAAKREGSKRKCRSAAGVDAEEKAQNKPEGSWRLVGSRGDSEDPDFSLSAAQPPQGKKVTLQHGSGQEDRHSAPCSREDKGAHAAIEQEEAHSSSHTTGGASPEGAVRMLQNSLMCGKSKASRQTFVIHKLEKDHLSPNKEYKETISENLEVAHEFQTADLSSKENGNLCDCETQNMWRLKKYVSDTQPAPQDESEVHKHKQKVNRKTEVISPVNQRYEDNGEDVHAPQQRGVFFQTRVDRGTFSEDFQIPAPFTRDCGLSCGHETQNTLDLEKPVTVSYAVQQNESKINKKLRHKVNRKTQIISEVNHFGGDKSVCSPEKGNSFFLQREMEFVPESLKHWTVSQSPALPTQDGGKPHGPEAQKISAVRRQVREVQAAHQNESESGKKLREQGYENAKITSELRHIHASSSRDLRAPEKDDFVSLTQKDGETVSEHPEVTCKFHTVDLPTKEPGDFCDCETQKNDVTSVQPPQQNEPKTKKRRQKVNRKTEMSSEMTRVHEDIDDDVHGRKSHSEDLNFKIHKSKPRFARQGLISEYCTELNSNAKENYGQVPDPSKLVKQRRKKSSVKAESILMGDQNKLASPAADSAPMPTSSEAGLKCCGRGTDAPGGPRCVTPDTAGGVPWVDTREAGQLQDPEVTETTSRAEQRKPSTAAPPGSLEAAVVTLHAGCRRHARSKHADQESHAESEGTGSVGPDFSAKMFRPFSQLSSPTTQGSSSDGVHEGLMTISVSSGRDLTVENDSAPRRSPVFQTCDDGREKMTEVHASVSQRALKLETGNRTLQDLTNTSFFSSNAMTSESEVGDGASGRLGRKRRCTPLSLREPSLKRKMRR